jgi:hypothetical protein
MTLNHCVVTDREPFTRAESVAVDIDRIIYDNDFVMFLRPGGEFLVRVQCIE